MFEALKELAAGYDKIYSQPFAYHVEYNPVVYDQEPYKPDETIQDLLNDYLNELNILREKYLETKDEKLGRLLLDLLPAAIYSSLN